MVPNTTQHLTPIDPVLTCLLLTHTHTHTPDHMIWAGVSISVVVSELTLNHSLCFHILRLWSFSLQLFNYCWHWIVCNVSSLCFRAFEVASKWCCTSCSHARQLMLFSWGRTKTVYLLIKKEATYWVAPHKRPIQRHMNHILKTASIQADRLYHSFLSFYTEQNMMFSWRFTSWSRSHLISTQLISCVYWNSNNRPFAP